MTAGEDRGRVLYYLQKAKQTGARSVGERLADGLDARTDYEVVKMVPSQLDLDTERPFVQDGDVFVPTTDLVSAVRHTGADIMIAHTVTADLLENFPLLNAMCTTLFRAGVNLTESLIEGNLTHFERFPEFIRGFDAVLAAGDHGQRKLEALGVDRERIYTVTPPAPAGGVKTDLRPVGDRPRAVGVASRAAAVKNLPIIPQAIRYYEDHIGDAPRVLLGGSHDADSPTLTLARELSVRHKFDVLGWCDPLTDIYPEVRATVQSSLSENFPAVYGESLACGTPVVAPRSGWAVGPYNYDADDPEDLAFMLNSTMNSPRLHCRSQRDSAPDGINPETAVEHLETAVSETHDRCEAFTLGVSA